MGERVGVRVPSGPRFGVDGAFEGYVRLPFTVGGPVAEEAASRLAAAARLVGTGAGGSGAEPRARSSPEGCRRSGARYGPTGHGPRAGGVSAGTSVLSRASIAGPCAWAGGWTMCSGFDGVTCSSTAGGRACRSGSSSSTA